MFERLRFVAQHLQSTGVQKLLRHEMFAHACRNSQSQSFETRNFFMIYGKSYHECNVMDEILWGMKNSHEV